MIDEIPGQDVGRQKCGTTAGMYGGTLYLAATDLFFFAGWCWRKPSFTAVTTSFLDSIGISEDTERFWLLEACAADSVYRDDQALLLSQESARAQAEEMRLSALLEVDGHGTVWGY